MKILNSFTLKVMAMIFMALDHIVTYIPHMPIWFGYIGKLAAPIFFYLIVEGFFHTRSRILYFLRLLGFGVIMTIIDLALGIHNNIFLSLALAVALMMAIEYGKKEQTYLFSTIMAVIFSVLLLITEASLYGLAMTLIFYFFRKKAKWMYLCYIAFSLYPVFMVVGQPNIIDQLFLFDYQWMMVFAAPFLYLYNGKQGIYNKFTKWMFYAFYPLHLIVIVMIGRL